MDLFFILPAIVVVANILYVGTAILQGSDDPRFEGDKLIYRS